MHLLTCLFAIQCGALMPGAEMQKCLNLQHPPALLLRFLCSTHLEPDRKYQKISMQAQLPAAVPALKHSSFISMLFSAQKFPDADKVIIDGHEEIILRLRDRDLILSL